MKLRRKPFIFRDSFMKSLPAMKRLILSLLVLGSLVGCATPHNNYDPLEPINRPIYAFNDGVDKVVLRPVAKTWNTIAPPPLVWGVHNFFGNIADLFAIPAALLQGKGGDAANSFKRVLLNSTAGVGGLIDVASDFDIPKSEEDFGQVLGYWGVPSGPYLMLPFLGPYTTRDIIDPAVQVVAGPTSQLSQDGAIAYTGTRAVDARVQLLPLDETLAEQYDKYAYIRDAYLQRRWFKVHDGNPPHALLMAADVQKQDAAEAVTSPSVQEEKMALVQAEPQP